MSNKNKFDWRAILVDAPTQAGKTKKCIEILASKLEKSDSSLVLFVTQANNVSGTKQILSRTKKSECLNKHISPNHIYRSNYACGDDVIEGNHMVVDFWHSHNMENMLDFVVESKYSWSEIIIIIDEADQGNINGIKERLMFIRKVEKRASENTIVKVILITATVANLSKLICKIAEDNSSKFKNGIVNDIINKNVVEHQFAMPHESYVGATWFMEHSHMWRKIKFERKKASDSQDITNEKREEIIMNAIENLPDSAKELTLIVTSTRVVDHSNVATQLCMSGYNVVVELNGTNIKNYQVRYVKSGVIKTWNIPYTQIEKLADNGQLDSYETMNECFDTGIESKDDITLPHILQSALFMKTLHEDRIRKHIPKDEFRKLEIISDTIMRLSPSLRRPKDYPKNPKIALIAGHIAGRGITIQNPFIDFTCTSFCFTDTKDTSSRGAANTQRFGRACGMLADVFSREDRMPILIATEGIVNAAVANEMALMEKARDIQNGTLISLKDHITSQEWKNVIKKTKLKVTNIIKNPAPSSKKHDIVDGVNISKLTKWMKDDNDSIVSKIVRFLYNQNNPVSFSDLKNGISYGKSDKEFQSCIRSLNCIHSKLGMLVKCQNYENITINQNIYIVIKDLLDNK